MIEALWSVEFASDIDIGTGVLVLETGRVLGGDNQYTYVGSYTYDGGVVYSTIKITHYAGPGISIFGSAKELSIEASGRVSHEMFELTGNIVGLPHIKIFARLVRRAELP